MANDGKRYYCKDCGIKIYNNNRADKHSTKTGHKTAVDVIATRAVEKYRQRQSPTYWDLLTTKDQGLYERGWN